MDPLIGLRLAGKYEIQSEIGRGGMGIVYRGYDVMLQRAVAIKVLPREFTHDQQFVARFRQEAITAAGLHHAAIVTIHDVGQQEGIHYIVMQLLEGTTLEQWLMSRGPLALPQANHLVRQICEALDYAHGRSIVHRDIKPANIMISPQGQVTVMDFGLVRAGEGSNLTRSGMVVGTPEYMAPEQALGDPVDARTDIYSLGVVIYKMLSGQVPFSRSTTMATAYAHVNEPPPPLRGLRPDLSKGAEAVAMRALAKKPADRYQRAGLLAEDFALAAAGKAPIGAAVPLTPPPASPKAGRGTPPPGSPPLGGAGSEATQLAGRSQPGQGRRRSSLALLLGVVAILLVALIGAAALLANRSGGGDRPGERTATQPGDLTATAAAVVVAPTATAKTEPTVTPALPTTAATRSEPTAASRAAPPKATAVPPSATSAPSATPSATTAPSATPARPTATATPAATQTPTPQPRSTDTPTSRPQPTATPTPRPQPSNTPTSRPQPTATPASLPAPALLSPAEGASASGDVTFTWSWPGPALAANQGFEVRVWKDGQPDHYGATGIVRDSGVTFNVANAYGVQQGGSGVYYWTVALVQVNPYQRIGPEAPPRRLSVEAGGGGGGGGGGGAPLTPTPR